MNSKKDDIKQAVIVDNKAIGCRVPGGNSNKKQFIQYTLEWLLIEEFDEVYVCCLPDNAQQLRAFVERFLRTENVPSSMSIHVHASEKNVSTGDCLRDLDSKALIKTDFVIMDVGCCGNLPLTELLNAHKRLRQKDKSAILTSVVRNLFMKNPEVGECPIYISNESGKLLHYDAGRITEQDKKETTDVFSLSESILVPSEIFLSKSLKDTIQIHTNLCSTNLSIYSANVPALFTELFDSHSEADLIQGAFDNHEVLGGTVYIHILDDLFSQRMADFGFAINQKKDKFDSNLIYERNDRCQVLRKLVNDSLIECTQPNAELYLSNLMEDDGSINASESSSQGSVMDEDEIFFFEVVDSLVRGFEEEIKNENLILEINSSKHAYNINIDDVYATIARAMLTVPHKLTDTKPDNASEYFRIIGQSIVKFKVLLLNYLKNDDARATFIVVLERVCLSKQVEFLSETVLAKVLYKLYEVDALDEDSIIKWFRDSSIDNPNQKTLRTKPAFTQLIQVLEAESSDEEDEDD